MKLFFWLLQHQWMRGCPSASVNNIPPKTANVNPFGVSSLAFVRDSSPSIHAEFLDGTGFYLFSLPSDLVRLHWMLYPTVFEIFSTHFRSLAQELALGSMSHLGDRLLFIIYHQYFSTLLSCHLPRLLQCHLPAPGIIIFTSSRFFSPAFCDFQLHYTLTFS